jgi:[acyl-carrier-protein] S-malonyltransferase
VKKKIAFMFPGQGSFQIGMGREIAEAMPEAMAVYLAGSAACGIDLRRLCFWGTDEELTQTDLQQPALVATSLAINAALRARSVEPAYVVGHSVGEFSALGAANSLGVSETIALVRERGLATAAAANERPGSMAAILGLADEKVETLCRKIANVWPANYNCPGQLVVSGETAAVDECCSQARSAGAARAVRLKVSGAFHSPLVEHAAERLKPALERIDFKTPTAQFVSTVTARFEEAQRYPGLLLEQLTTPVRFAQAARELIGQGVTTFVEVGPGTVLSGLLKRIDSSVRTLAVNDMRSLDAAAHELG